MWKDDNDKIDDVFEDICAGNYSDLPIRCPICEDLSLYFYIHRWHWNGVKGGLWIWCSKCKNFSHGTIVVPEWWSNCKIISIDLLNSLPINLEEHKFEIAIHYLKVLSEQS